MEILNQYIETVTISKGVGFNPAFFICLVGSFLFGLLLFLSVKFMWDWPEAFDMLLVIGFVGSLAFAIICFLCSPTPKEVTTYQVILNDNYPYNKLIEDYDIIDQEGKILTIREKGWESID